MNIAEHMRTDPEAGARRLVAELGAGLYALALRLCGNRTDADDLYLRTLERAVSHAAEQRGPAFGAWLRAICLNLWRSDLRRRALECTVLPEAADVPGEGPSPLDEVVARAEAEAVRAAMARLPAPYREALELRYWAGLSQPGVAAALGVSEGAAKVRLFRARALLRAELEPLLERNRP